MTVFHKDNFRTIDQSKNQSIKGDRQISSRQGTANTIANQIHRKRSTKKMSYMNELKTMVDSGAYIFASKTDFNPWLAKMVCFKIPCIR